jgi:hypothetical protein
MWLIVIGCAAWVYWDATKNKIGRQIDGPGLDLTNRPLFYAIGTMVLWFLFAPLYYFKRNSLIEKAKEKPVIVSDKKQKVVIIALGIAAGAPIALLMWEFINKIIWGFQHSFDGMGFLVYNVLISLYCAACGYGAIYVYRDATKHHIGADPNSRKLTDASPIEWVVGVILAWIIVFPMYLFKRKDLISIAQENPVEPSETQKKVVLGVLGGLFALTLLTSMVGDGNLASMVKKAELNDYPGISIGKLLNKSFDDMDWAEDEGENGIGLVVVSGTYEDEDQKQLVSIKFKVIPKTESVQAIAVYLNGEELPPYALERLFTRMYSRHGPKGRLTRDDANSVAQYDLYSANMAAQLFFSENPNQNLTLDSLKKNGLKLSDGVTLEILDGSSGSMRLSATHKSGSKVYEVDSYGNMSSELK